MTVEINIDQNVLSNELDIKRQFKSELESELDGLKVEASYLKKRQDILTTVSEGMSGIDKDIIDEEIKTISNQIWTIMENYQNKEKSIAYYKRLINRLEKMQD